LDALQELKMFKAGDTVRLKSGGPTMTIVRQHEALVGNWSCQWFDGKKLSHGVFAEETLVAASATPGPRISAV
jgi:uncharacterized protein YodC (DUF2158 family)